ncbi:MAG: FkbM family methyltransferase [Lentisphaerae bacterium]|nr:FkbM family methyltransferase [Lentisphaerota bacterium]
MTIDEIRVLYEYLRGESAGAVMVDVGAFRGQHLRPFLRDGWRVHAFEPDPEKKADLQALASAFPALAVHALAVSDHPAEGVPFFTSKVSAGIASLRAFHASHRESLRVAITTLDAFTAEQGLSRIDLLKIDAEGEDAAVLRGMPWDRLRPAVILCEFDEAKPGCPPLAEMATYLMERGYTLMISEWQPIIQYGGGGGHAWRRFARYPTPLEDAKAWGNVLAFRDGVDGMRFASAVARAVASPDAEEVPDPSAGNARPSVTAQAMIAGLEADVRFLKASRSWRWTWPLRTLEALAARLAGRR